MKKIFIVAIAALCCACSKLELIEPVFDVTTSGQTFKAGQEINFTLAGNPDFVSFYSGEPGSSFTNRNRTTVAGKPQLQFSTFAQNAGKQVNSLKILASTNFSGDYSVNGINAASWTDLTARATLSTGTDNTPSGLIDVSDLETANKPIYFAFKKRDENSTTLKPWGWTVRSFSLVLNAPAENRTYPVTDLAGAGWLAVDVLNTTYKWTISTTALTITGGQVNTPENEDWVISKPLNLYTVKKDVALPVKNITAQAASYTYTYNTPGTYTATFQAVNYINGAEKSTTKTLTLTIVN